MTLRIVVADDHGVVRDGLGAVLSAIEGYELVGTAATGDEAIRAAVTLQPDVVVMDIQMPGKSGIWATNEIRRVAPDVAVLVLTMFDDDDSVFAAIRAGALGYVLKGSPAATIIRAIAAVAEGEAIFGPGVARRTMDYLAAPRESPSTFPDLTDRESEVLGHVAAGLANAAIADRMGVTTKTVSNHLTNVFAKLQVASRAEAIIRARSAGMGQPQTGSEAGPHT